MVTSSPVPAFLAMGGVGTAFGLIAGGLLTLRPDHVQLISAVRTALANNRWALVLHPFNAAQVQSARDLLTARGYGPDYQLPGLPHRTGHGIGLDIHESPNLVRGDRTPLQAGMCFSNEPMIVIPGQFGVRLEDHFYMTEDGPRWFTPPAFSLEQPFGETA